MSHDFPKNLSTKQRQAAELLNFMSAKEVAERLNLRRETISRWKKQPLFVAECERCRAERHEYARIRFQDVFDSVIVRLIHVMKTGTTENAIKTAIALLKHFEHSPTAPPAAVLVQQFTAPPAPATALLPPAVDPAVSATLS